MHDPNYQCSFCGETEFDVNPQFLECHNCGTRYVRRPDGTLQKTTIYGQGQGSYGRRQAAEQRAHYAQQPMGQPYGAPISPTISGSNNTVIYNVNVAPDPAVYSNKSRAVALLLCIFLGYFGAHYFYLGRWGMGLLYFFTVGLFGFGWIFDIVRIAFGGIKDQWGRYAT